MQVDDALIEKLSKLSLLYFDEAEKEEIKSDLQKMIGFVDKLQELDTTGIEPLLHMSEEVNVFREDIARLSESVRRFNPSKLILVGDLFHSSHNREHEDFLRWRNDFPVPEIELVRGNHDILSKEFYSSAIYSKWSKSLEFYCKTYP